VEIEKRVTWGNGEWVKVDLRSENELNYKVITNTNEK